MKYNEVVVNISWLLLFIGFVQAQLPESLNIDCGETSSYVDDETGWEYVPDNEFIESGTIYNVSSNYNKDSFYRRSYWNLRSFPSDKRNCYRLKSVKGSTYLIRVTSLYKNYDNLNSPPKFDVYIGSDYWTTLDLAQFADGIYDELITVATSNLLFICLINTDQGIPIISEIRLITLPNHLYGNLTSSGALRLHSRWNVGSNETVSYPDDIYDRIWDDWNIYDSINTTNNITYSKVPSRVLQTASVPKGNRDSIFWWWSSLQYSTDLYHIVLHFAELEKLKKNESRKFNLYHEESLFAEDLQPRYLNVTTLYSPEPWVGKSLSFSINKTTNSTHPPLLNAMELFLVKKFNGSTTDRHAVEAIMGIKDTYQIKKNWMGDPCLPKGFPWSGLTCNDNDSPKITVLNLSSSGLVGNISNYLANISSIESIDLSNNNLTGAIPEFLAQLTSLKVVDLSRNYLTGSIPEFLSQLKLLKVLNLSNNQLSGSIPDSLKQRRTNGLQLSTDNNINIYETSDKSHPKKRFLVILIASTISAAVFSLIVLIIFCIFKSKNRDKSLSKDNKNMFHGGELKKIESENKKFTYKEILKMTKNFEHVIGKGGFGTVFSGCLNDGTRVAVKVLSESSARQFKEFSAETNLLMRIHHKNLVSFVGYCDEDTNMALIYEYMDRGNLRTMLSSDSDEKLTILSWKGRLLIALDSAQGLEYLHRGCNPPIIHRDVKTANILLNDKLEAKIADFGFSRVFPLDSLSHISTDVIGTPGYIDPEYYCLGHLNEKSDVYSFGIVLLELITGQRPIDKTFENVHIVRRVSSALQNGDIRDVIDPRLEGKCDISSALKLVQIALECTSLNSVPRPGMSQVVIELNQLIQDIYNERLKNETESDNLSNQYLDTEPLAR